ncbi:trehalose-phosphatase [Tessaracoccus aquimaris]|uniref:Trehalose 6-phosphate phosphatase n=1 Tax=Tessaracoccus aquimaris TaxID=1332264 RepID=A0A1Q2CLC3_9ACTN|nr:trehalose-phosphatase [Tessaracoccus aquimaris]AQP46914.1 trehalose-phosphatase [Tessaracoccus aquimaris]
MTRWTVQDQAGDDFMRAAGAHPERVLLALDFDGTLAPIVPDPDDSRLDPRAAEALARLRGRLGALAIITGRGTQTVSKLARLEERGVNGLIVAGGYGAQRWVVGEAVDDAGARPAGIGEALEAIREAIEACGVDGVAVEDKGIALGVHTRRSDDPDRAYGSLLPRLEGIASAHGLTIEPGRSVIELRASTVTKGDAIRALIEETGATVVAMCGDDLGDLPAFDALVDLRAAGLTTCRVVSASLEQSGLGAYADILAEGTDGIADWLEALADATS